MDNLSWDLFLSNIKSKLSSVSYNTWFKETKLYKQSDDSITIMVPMSFYKDYLNKHYYDLIDNIITSITGKSYDINFISEDDTINDSIVQEDNKSIKKDSSFQSNLNPNYTFDTFVIGDSNRFAQTAAVAVAEQPGKVYNP